MFKPAVEYFSVELAPSLKMFRCEAMRATLSTSACAANWKAAHAQQEPVKLAPGQQPRESHALAGERLWKCKTCPIGALHAGQEHASLSSLKGSLICGRCHRGAMRLVGAHLCVSCWNRERELIVGRNGKGRAPVKLVDIHARQLLVFENGERKVVRRARTASFEELYVMALRDSHSRVTFSWDPRRPALFGQASLW